MAGRAESVALVGSEAGNSVLEGVDRSAVLRELENILGSPSFRSSGRSKQFLSYVVLHKLDGHDELLKERSIGADLFHRPPDYATGDDPVVRVLAGEVRRRLEQYHHEFSNGSTVRIELPVGSYVPEFRLNSVELPIKAASETPLIKRGLLPKLSPWIAAFSIGLVAAVALIGLAVHHRTPRMSVLDQFWAPVFSSPQPVLISLSKPVLYRPSFALYRRYAKAHPGTFGSEVERLNQKLPLDPNEKIPWGEMIAFPDFGVGSGDVYAAFRLSAMLGRMNKPTQVRIGDEFSFDDLRNSPAVMIGAFSNRWTLEMISNLRFTFAERDGVLWIQDRTLPEKQWFCRLGEHWEVTDDFGIVTRLLDSKTGQATFAVGGITAAGSDAAAQFVSNPEYLGKALREAPPDWPRKNMQVVIQTTVIDSVAGSPHVVAAYFW
jgi:hypothetical protein